MKTYLQRFREMVSELDDHPKVVVLSFNTFPPVMEEEIRQVEASTGRSLDDSIKDFYRQTNGIQFRWITTENEDYDHNMHRTSANAEKWDLAQADFFPDDGVIMILPLGAAFLTDWKEKVYGDWMKDSTTEFEGNQVDLYEFSKRIRPFDLFSRDQDMAFYLDEDGRTMVLWGDDHHACYTRSKLTDFGSYLEFLLAQKGLVHSRKSFYELRNGSLQQYIKTPRTHWTPAKSFDIFGYLLKRIFPQADLAGADTSNVNAGRIVQLSKSSQPMSLGVFNKICHKHHEFLGSGGAGGRWETLSVSGLVIGLYRGAKGKKGEQANFERQHLPVSINLEDTCLPFANFCCCYAPGVCFAGAELTGCLFTDSVLEGAIFTAAKLKGTDFSRAVLRKADFRDADLTACDFENCDLRGANFTGANLKGSRFPGARLEGVKF